MRKLVMLVNYRTVPPKFVKISICISVISLAPPEGAVRGDGTMLRAPQWYLGS